MVNAAPDCLAQNGERQVSVTRQTEHPGPGQLHGSIAHSMNDAAAKDEAAGGVYLSHWTISSRRDAGKRRTLSGQIAEKA
jgi:hypothetical protein